MGTLHGHGSTPPENKAVWIVNPIPEHMTPLLGAGAGLLALLVTLGLKGLGRGRTSLVAALLIGSMLGPGVLGRIAPGFYDEVRGGDDSESTAQKPETREQTARAWVETQRAAGDTPASALSTKPRAGVAEPGVVHWGVAGSCLLLMGVVCLRDRRWSLAELPMGATLGFGAVGAAVLATRLIGGPQEGVSLAIFCGGCAAAACTRWGGFGARRLQMSGPARVSTLGTLLCLVLLFMTGETSENPARLGSLLLATPLLACLFSSQDRIWLSGARRVLAEWLPPMIVAVSMVTIDPLQHLNALWLGILAWLIMSDLRAVLAAFLLRSNGATWPRAWVTALQLMGSEVMPVALGGYAMWMLGLSTQVAVALFLAAAITQAEGMTRGTAGRIIRSARHLQKASR